MAATNQESNYLLQEIMHIIATSLEPKASLAPVLNLLKNFSNAEDVVLILFEEPGLIATTGEQNDALVSVERLKEVVVNLPSGIYTNRQLLVDSDTKDINWILMPIQTMDKNVGVICLTYIAIPDFTEEQKDILRVALDGLTIITRSILSQARQEKLGRNQSEFVRIVSHDLRSPLTSMQGFASMLESGLVGELNEKQTHFIEKILSGIVQMTSLVDNIQDAGRFDPETGFYEMQRSPCDLMEVIQKIIKNHLVPAEKQELSLSAVFADDVPIIMADVNMLERAILNLVDNAIKYTPNGRSVEVRINRISDEIIISVKDDGLGISEENQKMLFERHVRIPRKEHKKVKGSGLGLFIVRSIARRHGGEAWVKSVEGEGTTFFISIPLTESNMLIQHAQN